MQIVEVSGFGVRSAVITLQRRETDLPDEEDMPGELEEVFGGERDRRLLEALYRVHEKTENENIEVAVVYGAGHVTAIVRGLLERYGYRPRSADWVTVVEF